MEKELVNNQFEELLIDSDLRFYLKASPFEAGERSNLDTALTEDYYYEHLYAHNQNAEEKVIEIQNKIKKENVHNFILAGYKGCGKSTFVRYFLRKSNIRSRVINCDGYWDPDKGIKNNIVAYLDRLIEDDLFPRDEQEPCRVVKKYIELFCQNDANNYHIRGVDTENYLIYFGDKIEYAYTLSQSNENKVLRKYFETDIKIHILKGAESYQSRSGATISNIMTLILFWDIAARIANNLPKECCFVFENLDVIYNTSDVSTFSEHIIAFRNNVDTLVPNLWYDNKQLTNPTQDYILLFVMRETTEGEFASYIEHFSDGKVFFQPYTDISNIYDIREIVDRRTDWLKKLSEKNDDLANSENVTHIKRKSDLVLRLLEDQHLRKKLFGFFNNDYRTFIEVLSAIDLEESAFFNACDKLLELKKKDVEDWASFGYRSIAYREIFNIFVKEGYVDRLKNYEYSERIDNQIRSINLDRMILLYLSNSVTNLLVEEDEKQWQFVKLDTLFSEIFKFCSKADSIVDALWQMYDLRRESKWNHLITFDNMHSITRNELQTEMKAFLNGEAGFEYGRAKITLAGENYLNIILPHFEYYAARAENGKGHSLFSLSPEEWCDLERVNGVFKNQRSVIRDCCSRLYRFHTDVFCALPEYNNDAFLQSNFAAIKYSILRKSLSRMYHCERIIHSNIGYVNRLRFYIAYIMDGVLEKKGFDKDVNIKSLLTWFPKIDKSVQNLWPNSVNPINLKECILLKRNSEQDEKQRILVKMNNDKVISLSIPLCDCISIIKTCLNAKLVDVIKNYIRMFGIVGLQGVSEGKKCAMHSSSTEKLCQAFMACITDTIEKSGYTDFKTQIDVPTGNTIIRQKNKEKRILIDQERHEMSRKRQEEMHYK